MHGSAALLSLVALAATLAGCARREPETDGRSGPEAQPAPTAAPVAHVAPMPPSNPGPYANTPVPAAGELGGPRSDLTPEQVRMFELGREAFANEYTHQMGLGPYWETTSCAHCHFTPVLGGVSRVLKHNAPGPNHEPDAFQRFHMEGFPPRTPPENAYPLRPPPLFGVGLLAAVPSDVVIAGCDPDDSNGDGIRGRAHVWQGELLRLGSKAHDPGPRSFAQNAMFDDFNLTSGESDYYGTDNDAVPDPEVAEAYIDLLEAFLVGLAPPPTNGTHPAGERVFHELGCAGCHRPDLGPQAPGSYTDLCLHDMGEALERRTHEKAAGPRDYRTMPLWGLRHRVLFMHDGRAATVHDAILERGGEAAPARARYEALSDGAREDLMKFLDTI